MKITDVPVKRYSASREPRKDPGGMASASAKAVVLAVVLGVVATTSALAQSIPLPSDLRLDAPAAAVPGSFARFAGAWAHGAWDTVLPHVLVVESIDAAGRAQVVYAVGDFADGEVSRGYRRLAGRIDGDVLELHPSDRARAAYRLVGDVLHGTHANGRRVSAITLRRASLADVMRVPATAPGVVTATTVRIPLRESGVGGKPLTLEATLYRPAGEARQPVLLFNHGSTGRGAVAPTATLRPGRQAPFFVEHGFAVLAPMRRGRGASEGAHAESEGTCEANVLGPGLARAMEDVDATLAYLRVQPWADADRLLVGGQSRGGILSVAYAAERPGTFKGVINFAGGWTSDLCDGSSGGFNASTFGGAGHRTRTPMLWLYAEGDRLYTADSIRRYHDAFVRAGGVATFHLLPAFGGDGHRLVDRPDLWRTAAVDFLRRLNLPGR